MQVMQCLNKLWLQRIFTSTFLSLLPRRNQVVVLPKKCWPARRWEGVCVRACVCVSKCWRGGSCCLWLTQWKGRGKVLITCACFVSEATSPEGVTHGPVCPPVYVLVFGKSRKKIIEKEYLKTERDPVCEAHKQIVKHMCKHAFHLYWFTQHRLKGWLVCVDLQTAEGTGLLQTDQCR